MDFSIVQNEIEIVGTPEDNNPFKKKKKNNGHLG